MLSTRTIVWLVGVARYHIQRDLVAYLRWPLETPSGQIFITKEVRNIGLGYISYGNNLLHRGLRKYGTFTHGSCFAVRDTVDRKTSHKMNDGINLRKVTSRNLVRIQ